jgi:Amt family ammonium transporter
MSYTGTTTFAVDDPLDTVAIHLGGGFWGLISASIFSNTGLVFGITTESLMVRRGYCVLYL